MKPGAKIVANSVSYPDREFEGTVRTVGSRVDPVTRAFTVRAHVPNKDRALRPGMLLTVAGRHRRSASRSSCRKTPCSRCRTAPTSNGGRRDARQQQIEVGGRRFGVVEVLGGLQEGEQIVTEGIVKLRDGVTVRIDPGEAAISERSDHAEGAASADARS